jgi:hypothetical protein
MSNVDPYLVFVAVMGRCNVRATLACGLLGHWKAHQVAYMVSHGYAAAALLAYMETMLLLCCCVLLLLLLLCC